jgi:RHS repeat-associated protein
VLRILGSTPEAERGAAIAVELGEKVFAPLHDLQGNLTALIPIDGTTPSFYRYSTFGEEKIYGAMLSPWRFSSKRSDAETKLVYYGRRFYMPDLGRWLTPDPAGFTDGMNLYDFVHNEPLLHFDEYGLWLERRPPGSFDSSRIMRGWGNDAMAAWNNPRFQGGIQAFGGVAEASVGVPLLIPPFTAFGGALMLHGADHFAAGTRSMITGRAIPTASEILLQKMGMTPQWATFTNSLLSTGGVFGGINRLCYLTYQANRSLIIKSEQIIVDLEKRISGWLGEGTRFIRNGAGDSVILSKDGQKCVRFDFNKPKPHNNPHGHIEIKIDDKWIKSGPIYPTDVPHN